VGGYLELRPDRAGWGVEMDEALLGTEDYIHWERKVPSSPMARPGTREPDDALPRTRASRVL
jgi:hypothetical protein